MAIITQDMKLDRATQNTFVYEAPYKKMPGRMGNKDWKKHEAGVKIKTLYIEQTAFDDEPPQNVRVSVDIV